MRNNIKPGQNMSINEILNRQTAMQDASRGPKEEAFTEKLQGMLPDGMTPEKLSQYMALMSQMSRSAKDEQMQELLQDPRFKDMMQEYLSEMAQGDGSDFDDSVRYGDVPVGNNGYFNEFADDSNVEQIANKLYGKSLSQMKGKPEQEKTTDNIAGMNSLNTPDAISQEKYQELAKALAEMSPEEQARLMQYFQGGSDENMTPQESEGLDNDIRSIIKQRGRKFKPSDESEPVD